MAEQWTVGDKRGVWVGPVVMADGGNRGIAFVCGESDANARLIASAPDLLAALKLCKQALKNYIDSGYDEDEDQEAYAAAMAAIARAEGRAE
jgi:hypothetical protein